MSGTSWRVEIPEWRPATVNELLRLHWALRRRRKRIDREMISAYCYARDIPRASGRRRVDVEIRGESGRIPDPDNVWKSLLDALVSIGRLVDDSSRWCRIGSVTFPRGPRCTVITLTDIEET